MLKSGGRHNHTDKTHRGSDSSSEDGEVREKQSSEELFRKDVW